MSNLLVNRTARKLRLRVPFALRAPAAGYLKRSADRHQCVILGGKNWRFLMPSPYVDLALYDRAGRLIAIAEVKNKQGTSSEWAAKFRRNMLVHGGYSQADFFLLVTPDRLYLWKNASTAPTLIQPTYELDAQLLFAPYFERAGISPSDISGQAFELVVAAWLGDLVRSEEQREAFTEGQRVLAESGFLTAVRDGRIEYEEAA